MLCYEDPEHSLTRPDTKKDCTIAYLSLPTISLFSFGGSKRAVLQ